VARVISATSAVSVARATFTAGPSPPPSASRPASASGISDQWAAMVDENKLSQKTSSERVLNQEEIDGLLGFSLADVNFNDNSGIRAIIDSALAEIQARPEDEEPR